MEIPNLSFEKKIVPSVTNNGVLVRGWYPDTGEVYDASHLLTLPYVNSVHISGMPHAHNLDALVSVGPLEHLHLEIFKLDPINILDKIDPTQLRSLTLVHTSPTKLDIAVLERFEKLEELNILQQKKNLPAVGRLRSLKRLKIGLTTRIPCDFISGLLALEELTLLLGGQEDISGIVCPSLRTLQIIRVRGLNDIGDLSRFPLLETLHIENQPKIEALIASRSLPNLTCISAFSCPKLIKFEALENLPNLNTFKGAGTPLELPINQP